MALRHALGEDGVSPGLADDQVCPLHHNDTDEERCVARVLQHFPLFVCLKNTIN